MQAERERRRSVSQRRLWSLWPPRETPAEKTRSSSSPPDYATVTSDVAAANSAFWSECRHTVKNVSGSIDYIHHRHRSDVRIKGSTSRGERRVKYLISLCAQLVMLTQLFYFCRLEYGAQTHTDVNTHRLSLDCVSL